MLKRLVEVHNEHKKDLIDIVTFENVISFGAPLK